MDNGMDDSPNVIALAPPAHLSGGPLSLALPYARHAPAENTYVLPLLAMLALALCSMNRLLCDSIGRGNDDSIGIFNNALFIVPPELFLWLYSLQAQARVVQSNRFCCGWNSRILYKVRN